MTFSLSPQLHVLTDEPKWSSASLCITLNHLGQKFRPEYTHQVVEGECWRGYRPHESLLRTATADFKSSGNGEQDRSTASSAPASRAILHKSHENHDTAASQLEIRVMLSPSCRKCCVDVIRTESSSGENGNGSEGEPGAKRRRTYLGSEFQQQTNLSSGGTFRETNEQDMKTVSSSSESISLFPMKDAEIMGALCMALPTIASRDDNRSEVEDCFLSEPVGDILEEYSIPATEKDVGNLSISDYVDNDKIPSSKHFVLTIADGRLPYVSEYHRSVQNLALFYIENADTVDVANDGDGGFWKIMYIFQKHDGDGDGDDDVDDDDDDDKEKNRSRYSLVGYFTLFHFIALFHKPDPGLILRICQALILPPFQGQGHGRRLLQTVYNLAHKDSGQASASEGDSQYRNIIQVNVEDPAPAFVALRNKMDLKLVLEHYEEWNWSEKGSTRSSDLCKSLASQNKLALFFSAMAEKEASEMSVKAKITPKQIHIANELLKLKAIHASAEQQQDRISNADKETIERFFRLMVKKRLNKEHRDELLEQPTKDDQKAWLAKLFDKELEGYERILSKLHS
jgi:histone acetyltransferase 1